MDGGIFCDVIETMLACVPNYKKCTADFGLVTFNSDVQVVRPPGSLGCAPLAQQATDSLAGDATVQRCPLYHHLKNISLRRCRYAYFMRALKYKLFLKFFQLIIGSPPEANCRYNCDIISMVS